jgi:heterodisulfide reductase subunit A-like polyferredoxin
MKQPLEQILSAVHLNGTVEAKSNGVNGVNEVHEEKNGLKILIVGAGIGGLTAAIALRKQGHEVLVRHPDITFKGNLADIPLLRFSSSRNLRVS